MKTIVGLFDDYTKAETVVRELVDAGFSRENISVVANDANNQFANTYSTLGSNTGYGAATAGGTDYDTAAGNPTAHPHAAGAATGAVSGGVLGGVGGLVLGAGLLAIPGIGPVLAAGPIVAGITGAVGGAAIGGLIGSLVNIGVPREEAELYNEGVRRGGTLITVAAPDDRANEAAQIMDRDGAVNVDERGASYRERGYAGYDPDAQPLGADEITREREYATYPGQAGIVSSTANASNVTANQPAGQQLNTNAGQNEAVIPVVQEELQVGKRQVQGGGVRVYTHVTQTPVQEQVTLHEERVDVQRRPVDRAVTDADLNNAFQEGTIEVTETSEQAVVNKQARVVEEIVVNKTASDRVETVSDTVRRTDVDVQETGVGTQRAGYDRTVDTDVERDPAYAGTATADANRI